MSTSSPNSTDSDLTADNVHVSPPFVWPIGEMDDEVAELAQRQRPDSPTPTESGYDLVSNVGGQNDEDGTEIGNDGTKVGNDGTEVGTDPVAATLQHDKISEHQQQHPTANGRPPEKKKCLAALQVERKDKLTTDCRNLLYEFFETEAEPLSASDDEHCNPTVGHMMQTLLPKHFAMSMEQLTEMFDRQLQLLHTEFGEFFDIAPGEWCAERVKDRGKYKVLLHSKLDNNSASRIVGARKNVPENVGGGRRCDVGDVPMKGQQNANKEGERRCDDVPMGRQQNANNDWEPIDRFHVSGKGHLGNLYSVHSVTSNDLGFMRKKSNMRSPTEQRALKPYNDSIEECILLSIQDAERLVVKSDREADRKLQMEKIKGFKELLSLYNNRKKLIDTINASNSAGPKVIKAEDCFEELCKLPIFGPIIKQMYKVEQKTREDNAKEYKEEEARTGFMPKPSRNEMPGNRVEQYLNDLERQCPINFFDKLRKTSRGYGANNSQMASGSAGFRQQPESTNFDSFRRRIPVVSSVYNFARPSPAQPPQQPQQQKFESFSSFGSSTSRCNNNRFNGRTPSNGNQNQSRFGQHGTSVTDN